MHLSHVLSVCFLRVLFVLVPSPSVISTQLTPSDTRNPHNQQAWPRRGMALKLFCFSFGRWARGLAVARKILWTWPNEELHSCSLEYLPYPTYFSITLLVIRDNLSPIDREMCGHPVQVCLEFPHRHANLLGVLFLVTNYYPSYQPTYSSLSFYRGEYFPSYKNIAHSLAQIISKRRI